MPTTRQNIEWIKDRNPNYSPEQILEVLDEVHYRVRSLNIDYNYYLDPATGMPPFLATTDGVYVYECPDNCRKTSGIFIYRDRTLLANRSHYRYGGGAISVNDNTELINWGGREYSSLNYTRQQDKTLRDNAKVYFSSEYNPGTTTDKYRHLYWTVPVRLETPEDEMDLPEEFSFEMRQAVSSMLSTEDYGETGFDTAILDRLANKIANGLSVGSRRRPTTTNWPREYRS